MGIDECLFNFEVKDVLVDFMIDLGNLIITQQLPDTLSLRKHRKEHAVDLADTLIFILGVDTINLDTINSFVMVVLGQHYTVHGYDDTHIIEYYTKLYNSL